MPQVADKIIWWLMVTFMGVIIMGGGAWASTVNGKIDRIAGLEANIQYIQTDISEIKTVIYDYVTTQRKGARR